jgi:hypothetical protein
MSPILDHSKRVNQPGAHLLPVSPGNKFQNATSWQKDEVMTKEQFKETVDWMISIGLTEQANQISQTYARSEEFGVLAKRIVEGPRRFLAEQQQDMDELERLAIGENR